MENEIQTILLGETKLAVGETYNLISVNFELPKNEMTEFQIRTIENKIKAICEIAEKRLFSYEVTYYSNNISVRVSLSKEW